MHALLIDRDRARALARRARAMVHEQYGWAAIARRTAGTYASAVTTAERATRRMTQGRALPHPPSFR
ncbi:hypothetical protein AB0J20_22520 [Micromonospora costi]|uniref:hypothetical protein n=1 Tax=Micromonospora costi TaxID=1530042 RepID=UPI0033DF6262